MSLNPIFIHAMLTAIDWVSHLFSSWFPVFVMNKSDSKERRNGGKEGRE